MSFILNFNEFPFEEKGKGKNKGDLLILLQGEEGESKVNYNVVILCFKDIGWIEMKLAFF